MNSDPRSEFSVHLLNHAGLEKARILAQNFSDLLDDVEAHVPPGRERALVITKLQEACFFAKRGVALDPANQQAAGV